MQLTIETEQEIDGRWLAEVRQLPGVLAYGTSEDDALSDLKAKMGLLEAPKGDNAKQLGAGAVGGKADKDSDISAGASLGSLTAEDLKELEDLDLSELEGSGKEAKKA